MRPRLRLCDQERLQGAPVRRPTHDTTSELVPIWSGALGLGHSAMHPAHAPGALWKHHASQSRAPLLKGVSVRLTKSAKLGDRLKEHLLLPTAYGEGRISISEQLEALGTPIGGETADTVCAERAPTPLLDLRVGAALLAPEPAWTASRTAPGA